MNADGLSRCALAAAADGEGCALGSSSALLVWEAEASFYRLNSKFYGVSGVWRAMSASAGESSRETSVYRGHSDSLHRQPDAQVSMGEGPMPLPEPFTDWPRLSLPSILEIQLQKPHRWFFLILRRQINRAVCGQAPGKARFVPD